MISKSGIMKKALWGVVAIAMLFIVPMSIGINDAGHRTVVQWPNGTTFVKFSPGMYIQAFGTTWEYNDVITYDFKEGESAEGATIDQDRINVRYQDGGLGSVNGVVRFRLPADKDTMLKVHKEFRSNQGVAQKLLINVTQESMNQTAGLMSSEASYAEKRGIFGDWAKDQIVEGPYKTSQRKTVEVEYGYEYCLEEELAEALEAECDTIKRVTKWYPTIKTDNGRPEGAPLHKVSDLKEYAIVVSGFSIVDWDYEPKTLEQISTKRAATMAIITAKANAERAKQDTITIEEQGIANVKQAQYVQEVEKVTQVVIAEREKAVAVIAAEKLVEVAEQNVLKETQNKLAMQQYKLAETERGLGDAAYKRQVIEADGALAQKLATYERVNAKYATAIGQQKWVPEVEMGGSTDGGGQPALNLIEMFSVKTARDLALDMSIKK